VCLIGSVLMLGLVGWVVVGWECEGGKKKKERKKEKREKREKEEKKREKMTKKRERSCEWKFSVRVVASLGENE